MNTLFLATLAFIGFATVNAQEVSKNIIGLRLGDSNGFSAEISYQKGLSDNNRLEINLGLRNSNNYDGFKLTGIYQWIWILEGNFNWYAGAGAGVGSYNLDKPFNDRNDDSEISIFVAGNTGIEYNFDFPLQLSIDARPEFGFGDFRNDLDFDIALGARYRF